ncbi:MAG: DegT/DnrJ/EryC1/StrS family aminotransferase [Solirubrobacteraceae bacterium]
MTVAAAIPLHKVNVPDAAQAAVAEILASGYVAAGATVREFEERLGQWLPAEHVVTVGDYSAGIQLALTLGGVGPGDRVIATPDACLGTNMPLLNVGATPSWVDLDPATGNIDPEAIRRAITPRTKAILYAHWGGSPADIDAINAIGREHGLLVVEDASEALGAEHAGARVGAHGSDVVVLSFGPVRHLTTGEGAALVFADAGRAEEARWRKRYGIHQPSFRRPDGEIDPASDIPAAGWNTYLNNIGAAIGLAGLERIDETLRRHRENAESYDRAFAGSDDILPLEQLPGDVPASWVYTIRSRRRDALRAELHGAGIAASTMHLRNDLYSAFGTGPADHLLGVREFAATRLCIPCGWWVGDDEQERIAAAVLGGPAS